MAKVNNRSFSRFTAVVVGSVAFGLVALAVSVVTWVNFQKKLTVSMGERTRLQQSVASISGELTKLKNDDQYVKNQRLQADIGDIETTYSSTVSVYEDLLRLKDNEKDTSKFDARFADILSLLSKRNYATASSELTSLKSDIADEQQEIAAAFVIPQNVPTNNAPPGSGFSQQSVATDVGSFLVDIIAADLGSAHVYVDTASTGTCTDNCPVKSLGDYVAESGAFAGVNGGYFCPADYPSCAGKVNSFDTLLINKNKAYFNSDNNKFSVVPAVIFGNGFVRFVGQSLEWGRDTSIDSMIANQPLVVSGGNNNFGGNTDPKMTIKSTRGFVSNKGNTVFIGMIFNASVADMGHVLKTMGMENALNLDDGGSAALWFGGYKVGPGRNLPNAIVFVRK